ncbi:hypothetical protein GB937_007714 [Aspergillus fischeri]|nr:hypothetical protein GB937_007714 [Aspergillus fischeri]
MSEASERKRNSAGGEGSTGTDADVMVIDAIEMEVSFAASVDGKFGMDLKKGFAVDEDLIIQWSS